MKIIAKELDHALAGLPLYVARKPDEVDIYKVQLLSGLLTLIAVFDDLFIPFRDRCQHIII